MFFSALYANQSIFTPKEKLFIQNHPLIHLASSDGFEPFVIKNKDDSITGHDKELLDLVSTITGLKFEITLGDWKTMQERTQKKEFDGLISALYTEERELYANSSNSYITAYI